MKAPWLAASVLVLAQAVASGVAWAGPDATDDGRQQLLRAILEQGWGHPITGVQAARRHFETFIKSHPHDPLPYYAFGLVLLKNHRYEEALKQFGNACQQRDQLCLPAWRASIWLCMLRHQYPRALQQLAQSFDQLHSSQAAGVAPERLDDYAAWAGRVAGYLEGPGAKPQLAAARRHTEEAIRKHLTDRQKKLFLQGKQAVIDKFRALTSQHEQTRKQALEQERKKKEAERIQVKEQKAELDKQQQDLSSAASQRRQELEKSLKEIDGQYAMLERQFADLSAQARDISLSVRDLEAEIADLAARRDQAQADGNSSLAFSYQRAINQHRDELTTLQRRYRQIEQQAALVKGQAAKLLIRRQEAIRRYQDETGQLYQEKKKLDRQLGFLEKRRRRIEAPPTGRHGRVLRTAAVASALRTYVPFDVNQAKAELLGGPGAGRSRLGSDSPNRAKPQPLTPRQR